MKRPRVARPVGEPAKISATEFKATCLELMDRVHQTRETIVITKHGKPVAQLGPLAEAPAEPFGAMAGTVTILGDIISPIDVTWEATEDGFDSEEADLG